MEYLQNDPQGAERRDYPRLNIVVVSSAALEGSKQEQTYSTKNIGAGGLCILAKQQIDVNTIISLHMNIPDGKPPIEAKGKIVWNQKEMEFGVGKGGRYVVGIGFTEITDSDRKRIYDYVAQHIEE